MIQQRALFHHHHFPTPYPSAINLPRPYHPSHYHPFPLHTCLQEQHPQARIARPQRPPNQRSSAFLPRCPRRGWVIENVDGFALGWLKPTRSKWGFRACYLKWQVVPGKRKSYKDMKFTRVIFFPRRKSNRYCSFKFTEKPPVQYTPRKS